MLSPCASAFLATFALPPDATHRVAQEIDALLKAAQTTWPTLALDEAAFGAWVAQHAREDGSVSGLLGADLYLAFACLQNSATALRAFEAQFFVDLPSILARIGASDVLDEVAQLLRLKLFIRAGGADPAIARYTGRVELRGWFHVVALRTALNLRRATRRELPLEGQAEEALQLLAIDPELAHLRERYQSVLVTAFEDALASLPAKERHVLQLHYVDQASIDRIGAIHRVHRATAARWLVRIREGLIARTRALLGERLSLTPSELASLLRIFESTVEVDLAALLARRTPGGGA